MRLNFAITGDPHGRIDLIYSELKKWERKNKRKIHAAFLLGDLDYIYWECEDNPIVNSTIDDFFYGKKEAPYSTYFVSGNNDEDSKLRKRSNGGKIAKNFYYLGRSGTYKVNGVRIGGLSGQYRKEYYDTPAHELSEFSWRYFCKEDVDKLKRRKMDILLLHDWIQPFPETAKVKEARGISKIHRKYKNNHLCELVERVKPKYVFMGHRHKHYIKAVIGKSKIFGLMRVYKDFTINSNYSYKVISIESGRL